MTRFALAAALVAACAAPSLRAEEASPAPAPEATQTDRRLEEVRREREVKREADRMAARALLGQARRSKDEGRLEEALKALEKAAALVPGDAEVAAELQGVRSALGITADRRHEILEELARSNNARQDQQRVVVEAKVEEGRRLIAQGRFADALEVLKEAQETVRWMSYGSPEGDRWRLAVGELLNQAEQGTREEEAARRDSQMRKAEGEASKERELVQLQRARRLDTLRAQGKEALEQGRWEEAERIAEQIDSVNPGDSTASQLKLLARERRHVNAGEEQKSSYSEEWANLREMSREQLIPYSGQEPAKILRHPSNWEAIRQRAREALSGESLAEPEWKQVYRERLRHRIPFTWPNIAFSDCKAFLEQWGRVTINVTGKATEENPDLLNTNISLASPEEGMTLESALNSLTGMVKMRWTLRDETIVITTEADMADPPVAQQYDVRDLIGEIKDFVGPSISIGGGKSEPGIDIDTVEESDEEGVTGDTLVDFIKEYVDKKAWEAPENSIQFKNGKLFVTASPKTHKAIQEALGGFRNQRTLQVLIQSRFIEIHDTTFETLGVDWDGLASHALGGTGASNPSTVGDASPGFWNYGPTHAQGSVVTSSFLGQTFPRTFNGNPTTAGGLVGSIAFLDDFQVQAILTAVEKNSKANILTAPSLLAFNTQRANMVNVTQQAYIQDYTAVVQVQAVGYDPEIGYVMTGIVFDVRPIVSADRKYITLELRPTVSLLQQFRSVPAVGGSTGGLYIEAPIVQLQAIRTTVSVPDGGTIMIGGLTQYDETKNYSAVPFLSKIPFLKTFFSSRADAQNRQSLVILVKAQVIDQKEIEEARFGKE